MRTRRSYAIPGPLLAAITLAACVATAPHGIQRQTDEGAGGGEDVVSPGSGGASSTTPTELPTSDPHAVFGASPSHGPFNGGQRVTVTGRGFTSSVRVWFGDVEVDAAHLVPIGPTSLQITTVPSSAGAVDVTVQNGDDASTKRTLAGGYTFDALYAEPSSGPISGGTLVELYGQGTAWDSTTVATIDQKPCATLEVVSPTHLTCAAPQGTPGAKTVAVTTGEQTILVLDGYAYEDSVNGFKGGLSGAALSGQLKALVFDNYTGDAVAGAYVIAGSDASTAVVGRVGTSGVATLSDPSLVSPTTVTIAAECKKPISFVDVGVDTVTAYLDPILSPACGQDGDPPPVGGKPSTAGQISGQLSWGTVGEFRRAPWTNVPEAVLPKERQIAYLFLANNDPTSAFSISSASATIFPDSPESDGEPGYPFSLYAQAGNRALYVLAGLQNNGVSPPRFTAYSMGLVKGVGVQPGKLTSEVFVNMVSPLDGAITMDVEGPAPGPRGPDRLLATVAVSLGNSTYAILPAGRNTSLLPSVGSLSFVGVPWLGGDLLGSTYVSTARAATGPSLTAPLSVVGRVETTSTAQPVTLGGFVGVPTLVTPATNAAWDGRHLETSFPAGPVDLTVYELVAGSGLVTWTVVVPHASRAIELPDLDTWDNVGLPHGPLKINVYGGRVSGFSYDNLRYRDIRPSGMTAYSLDTFSAYR